MSLLKFGPVHLPVEDQGIMVGGQRPLVTVDVVQDDTHVDQAVGLILFGVRLIAVNFQGVTVGVQSILRSSCLV